jgi:hypothetical protein
MAKVAKRPLKVAALAIGVACGLGLAAVAGFVAMVWTLWQVFMLPF